MSKLTIAAAAVLFTFSASGMAFAASKCDSSITKAAGKKVACKDGVYSKGQKAMEPPNAEKLTKCEAKFDKACQKAKTAGDCVVQQGSCAQIEAAADACALSLSTSASPSGAFLE